MIIDAHTHIFPEEIISQREHYFINEPAFQLLYKSPKTKMVTAKETLAMMEQEEVDRAVVFGIPWQQMELTQRHNDVVLEAVQQHSDRFLGLCCVDPLQKNATQEVERCLKAGCVGVGEIAFYDSDITDEIIEALEPVMSLCQQFDRPVLIHANEPVGRTYPGKSPSTIKQLYKMICRFPQTKIILAHFGGGLFFYASLKEETKDIFQNLWIDCAAAPYLYQPQIYQISTSLLGEDKLLFGSDFPLLPPSRYFEEMEKIGLSDTQLRKIKGENAAALFL